MCLSSTASGFGRVDVTADARPKRASTRRGDSLSEIAIPLLFAESCVFFAWAAVVSRLLLTVCDPAPGPSEADPTMARVSSRLAMYASRV
jgi:hypothetical protein